MALTLQRKLELAGDLAKVQPLLQRLHVVKKPEPKKRHLVRNVILVGSAIAVGAAVFALVFRRRGCQNSAVAGDGGYVQTGSTPQDAPAMEPQFDAAVQQPTSGISV